jgi:hypothetical protein
MGQDRRPEQGLVLLQVEWELVSRTSTELGCILAREAEEVTFVAVRYVEGGHAFLLDEDGDLKEWDGYNHGGYECLDCDFLPCRWCHLGQKTEKCPEAVETLEGMDSFIKLDYKEK